MASPNERVVYAARTDSTEMASEVLSNPPADFDVNWKDGLGMTALHYAVSTPSPEVLDLLLDYEHTDVDIPNRMQGAAPLHLAVKLENAAARRGVTELLLECGADPRVKNKHGEQPIDTLGHSEVDDELRVMLRRAEADTAVVAQDDIASDGEGEAGGSGSDSDA